MKKVLSVVALFVMIGTFAPLSLSYSEGYTVIQLTDNSWADHDPRINDSNYVVWWGMGGTDYDIFLYDGTAITQLTDNEYDDWEPQINDNGQVVWSAWNTGNEIYLYDGSAIAQFTDNDYRDREPHINNTGCMVWVGWVGYESIRAEIFMAEISLAPPVPDGVQIDIKPGSCLNPLNVKSKGVLPVAILGSEGFDVYEIDPTSVTLEGVSPIRYSYEDVATPAEDELGDCSNLGADGYDDLVLKFRVQDLDLVPEIAAVTVEDEKAISLSVTGDLRDGTPIGGADWVTVIK